MEAILDATPVANCAPAPAIGPDWIRWLAKNRMLGIADHDLVEILVNHGFPRHAAADAISRLGADPVYQAGSWIAERLQKLESICRIQEDLHDIRPSSRQIERRCDLSAADFYTQYYAQNRPVVLSDFADRWPALDWSLDRLEAVLGDVSVEVMSGRDSDGRYELNTDLHRTTTTFRDFAARVRGVTRSNDDYLVANNKLLERPAAAPLWRDFDAGRPPLDGATAPGQVFLWVGPEGTITPLHHDVMNVLFVQLHGRKRFTLLSPALTPRVYNDIGVYASVDPVRPDYAAHPAYQGATSVSVDLEAGDTLFLPVGWWHRVESLSPSISVTFTNFSERNSFTWKHPSG